MLNRLSSIIILLSVSYFLISCSIEETPTLSQGPIPTQLTRNVVHSIGVGIKLDTDKKKPKSVNLISLMKYDTGIKKHELVVVNSLTGEEVKPCQKKSVLNTTEGAENYSHNSSRQECKTKFEKNDKGEYELRYLENNKLIEKAKTIEIVIATFEGSVCNTSMGGGHQFESCLTCEATAKALMLDPADCAL